MFKRLRQGLRFLRDGDRLQDDIRREMEFHVQMEAERRRAAGVPPDEARRTALRDFGGFGAVQEQVRDVRGLNFWDHLAQDLRFGWRTLRRSPGYAFAAVLTLGLGIGANTAMFSVINGALLHPLPYRDSAQLIRVRNDAPLVNQSDVGVSIAEARDLRRDLTGLESFVEYHQMHFVLLNQGEPHRVNTGVVSSQFFDVFGIKPALGRTFVPSDDVLGAEPVLILSHAFWQKQFGGDANVVGKVVQMNDRAHTIVGVLPAIGQYPNDNDVYMPTSACPFRADAEPDSHTNHRRFAALLAFGRMKPGVTLAEINAAAQADGQKWSREDTVHYRPGSGFKTTAVSIDEEITHDARPIMFTLIGTTALVLLIACANVANLALSRTLRRDRELAVRSALGASRGRLTRQLVTESLILAVLGGAIGLAIASPTARLLAAFASRFTPRIIETSIDGVTLGFTLAVALVTGLVFGTAPALSARRTVVTALKDGGGQSSDAPVRQRLRSALVVAQVTVAFALVVGAGLFLQSLHRLATVDLGFKNDDHVLTAQLHGNFSHQQTAEDLLQFLTGVLAGLKAMPGVQAAAISNAIPLTGAPGALPVTIRAHADPRLPPTVDGNIISSEYFDVLGTPLVRGRTFDSRDTPTSAPVAIINQSMAKLWDQRDPIGDEFTVQISDPHGQPKPLTMQVVGIVTDMKQYSIEQEPLQQFYVPMSQGGSGWGPQVLLRTTRDPLSLAGAVKTVVHQLDNEIPVEDMQTLEDLRQRQLRDPKLAAVLLGSFAGLALLITLAGIAAVIATSVSQRTREFGVRMALGASRSSVLTMVLGQGARLVAVGLVLGAASAVGLSRVLARYLFDTAPTEPLVYLAVAGVVFAAGTLACLAPARRATRVDPLRALRAE
ncbi:MAG TPA: ABC transporter permease [Vicinamibacterales bacterium]|nr:ABC transporter permease [Vicinamibacterales bacterium]